MRVSTVILPLQAAYYSFIMGRESSFSIVHSFFRYGSAKSWTAYSRTSRTEVGVKREVYFGYLQWVVYSI